MTITRTRNALATVVAAVALLSGCATPSAPASTPPASQSPSASPSASTTTWEPPADEDEAVEAAEVALTNWFKVRGEVNAAGGTDIAALEEVATGRALEKNTENASRIANGPILNEDGENVEGPVSTEGAITYELIGAYGQDWQGVTNGLVTINACQDATGYVLTANDGSPAMREDSLRNLYDYQVTYDAEQKTWLVYDLISLEQTC